MQNNISWRQFEAGREYNQRIGLYQNAAVNERFYRGDQWKSVNASTLQTPVFNIVRRITDYLVAQAAASNVDIVYSDENLPFVQDEDTRARIAEAVALLNRNAAYRWEKCRLDRLVRQLLLDAALTGDGVLFTYWDPSIVTGQAYTGDFVTTTVDGANLFVADVNSTDLQGQAYIILSGRAAVSELRAEALDHGASPDDAAKILPDGDLHYGAGDCAALENTDVSMEKATYIIKFYRNRAGIVCFEKSTRDCIIRTAETGLRLYPVAMMNWIPTKNSYHGTSPVTSMIQNQKYINKAYALLMKHMIDTAFSKVIYDKTRIPEWTNEVGQSIGVVGGDLNGVATTVSPGAMDERFGEVIDSVLTHTKETMGATDASLGETNPTNTSAIVALQEANSVTLDSVRGSLYNCLEELAAIWVDFMCAYYADGRMVLSGEGVAAFDCRLLRGELISARVDVGSATRFSKASALAALDKLLDGGHITLKQYLERLPDGVIPMRAQLIDEVSGDGR
ncbi:MAG: hypothetical protein IJ493_11735 [Clostridia bacterium]|nr:hypothetical protein [Clostridia bacterium]